MAVVASVRQRSSAFIRRRRSRAAVRRVVQVRCECGHERRKHNKIHSVRAKAGQSQIGTQSRVEEHAVDAFSKLGEFPGRPSPLGASRNLDGGGVNFAIHIGVGAERVSILLYSEASLEKGEPVYEYALSPQVNRTGSIWHIRLDNVRANLLYAWRVCGTEEGSSATLIDETGEVCENVQATPGQRFDGSVAVIDPYARSILSARRVWGDLTTPQWPVQASSLPCHSGEEIFDWEGDCPPGLEIQDLIIYEAHVRGFTVDPSSRLDTAVRGTYAGMCEKLDYLAELGINALELMPIHEFNELEYYDEDAEIKRFNYWGYSSINFFSPNARFSAAAADPAACDTGRGVVREFKTLVKECHKRGIEVILDVVFNHTAEGNERGPTLSFRGLDNRTYYTLAPGGEYYNYSGCGNTFNCNHPIVRQFIVDCLRYWVVEMHVDGFRFDLAPILTRANSFFDPPGAEELGVATESGIAGLKEIDGNVTMTDGSNNVTGTPLTDPPLVDMISNDPILKNTKLIAEAWDADGLNQVGAFPHYGVWAEWNGNFRDNVRQFIKGTEGPWTGLFAASMCGSIDMYAGQEPSPENWWATNGGRKWYGNRGTEHSINFITAHDGFTLRDLVSYNEKHNEANGEENNDGENHNLSWNCGEEGGHPASLPVERVRQRLKRNHLCSLFLAHGVPMLVMGDEYGHTKEGNNNTYCHDSHLNWFDWDKAGNEEQGKNLVRFTRHLITLRLHTPALRQTGGEGPESMTWHGTAPYSPDWSPESDFIAFSIPMDGRIGEMLYAGFNTGHTPKLITLPPPPEGKLWQPVVDTAKPAPFDVLLEDECWSRAEVQGMRQMQSGWLQDNLYTVTGRSTVLLVAMTDPESPQTATGAQCEETRKLERENKKLKQQIEQRGRMTSR